jgi:hypothetical protein
MAGIASDGLDQAGHEIAAAAKLDVDAAPALAHQVAGTDQAVEDDNSVETHGGQNGCGNPLGAHGSLTAPDNRTRIPAIGRTSGA